MLLEKLALQNFRSYPQKVFEFTTPITVIVGPNTAGKTNLVESIMLLALGKSFRAEKETEIIRFEQEVAWIKALVNHNSQIDTLEIMVANGTATGGRFTKKYLVNGVSRTRSNFIGFLPVVLFRPEELDIIVDGPSMRRNFLDDILEQADKNYRIAKGVYEKALRQRNALLDLAKETGMRREEQFQYWDNLLIANGNYLTQKRESFISFINNAKKDIIDFMITYDESTISQERLLQYKDAEIHAGMTLVGPQRDDFYIEMKDSIGRWHNVQHYGSRGQQRLVILQLKMLHINYTETVLSQKPLLVLDDIFSELDERHIQLVMKRIIGQQVIMTTTHKEFINMKILGECSVIELGK